MPRAGLLIAQFEALPEAAQKEALEQERHKANKRRASAGAMCTVRKGGRQKDSS